MKQFLLMNSDFGIALYFCATDRKLIYPLKFLIRFLKSSLIDIEEHGSVSNGPFPCFHIANVPAHFLTLHSISS